MSIFTILFLCAFNIFSAESIALSVSVPNFNYVEQSQHNEIKISDKLADVIIETAPQKIQSLVDMMQQDKSFKNFTKKSLILTGATGVGKTHLAQSIAKKSGLLYQNFNICALYHGYKTEKQVLYELIEQWNSINEPTVVIFDNVDFLDSKMSNHPVLSHILYEGLAKLSQNENVFFIATTLNEVSLKYDLYSGNLRPILLELTNPDALKCEKILRYYLGEKHNLHDIYIKKLANYMVNQSPRVLKQFVSSARMNEYSLTKNGIIEEIDCEKILVKMKIKRSYFSKFLSNSKKFALFLNKYIDWPILGSIIAGCIQIGIAKYNYDTQINYQREMYEISTNYHLKSYPLCKK